MRRDKSHFFIYKEADKMKEMRYKGHPVSSWRKLYEQEFDRDTSVESDKEFVNNHRTWINNNLDPSRHCLGN